MNTIVTIGREFGSGGREIGIKLADTLGVPFYDKEIITLTAEFGGLEESFVASNEEGSHLNGAKGIGRMSFASFSYKPNFADSIFLHQCEVVRQISEKGPCVIVGRCADYVLAGKSVNVFIAASMASKIARKRSMAPEKADFTDEQMSKYIEEVNKNRCQYYEHYTNQKWGNIQNFHLCVHSDLVGIDGSVKTIMTYLENAGCLK